MPTATYLVDHLAAGEEKFKIGRGWRWNEIIKLDYHTIV